MFDIFLIQRENKGKPIIDKKEYYDVILSNKKSDHNNKFYWINCLNPTEEELKILSDITGIKKYHFSDVLLDTERATISKGKWLFISYSAVNMALDNTTSLGIFSYKNVLITIEKEPIRSINKYKYILAEKKRTSVFYEGKSSFIYHIFDGIDDDFRKKINSEMKKIKKMEEGGFKSSPKKNEEIYESIVNHIYLQNALSSNLEVLNAIRKGKLAEFRKLKDNFLELYEDQKELLYMEKIQKDITNTLFEFYSSSSMHEMNETMKKITGWGFIILLPTLLASIYGMNFRVIPFSQGTDAFLYMNVVMFLMMAGQYLFLRKIKWL
ncbi:MAG: magnesium transporter CorA family protein [Candidatus Aenigmarchaeota archaeon]|nr:magnesium transporter CorA family protein [Candidatus Aenigmarchaeota archaeon]